MRNNKLVLVLFFALTLLSFRGFLTSEIIYTTWDFAFPVSLAQVQSQLERSMSIITAQYSLGYADNQNPLSFYFWLYIYPLAMLGAQHTAKILLGVSVFLSGIFMYRLLRYLQIGFVAAVLFSVYFMFNPLLYSRMIAGHYSVVAGIPFSVLYVHSLLRWLNYTDKNRSLFLLTCISFVLSTFHPMMIGILGVMTVGIILYRIFQGNNSKHIIRKSLVLGVCLLLMNAHWLIPMGANFFRNKPYFRGDVTVREEKINRLDKVIGSANPIWYPLFFYNRTGLDTEYAYPVHSRKLWFGAQVVFLGLLTLGILVKRRNGYVRIFSGLFLLGVILTSGMGNTVGAWLYTYVLSNLGPVFFEFSNSNRFLFLTILNGSILMAFGFDWLLHRSESRKIILLTFATVCVSIRVFSFFDNSLFEKQNDMTTPYAYFKTPFNDNQKYILHLFNEKSAYRKALAPPFQIAPVGTAQMNYGIMAGVSFINDFFNGYASEHPFQHFVLSSFASPGISSPRMDLALSLANVSDVYFPKYDMYYYFLNFGIYNSASDKETLYESDESIEATLDRQSHLVKDTEKSRDNVIDVYRNTTVMPRIYGLNYTYLLSGSYNILFPVMADERYSMLNSTVLFARTSRKKGLEYSTDVILPDGNSDELLHGLFEPEYAPAIMTDPNRQIKKYSRGELALAAIPGKRKGIALDEGSYTFPLLQNSDTHVALIHVATSSASVTLNQRNICTQNIPCSQYHKIALEATTSATLTVQGGRLYLADVYIPTRVVYEEKSAALQSLLQHKNVHRYDTESNTVIWSDISNRNQVPEQVEHERISPDTYLINIPDNLQMLYFSQQFDEDWYIEGYPDLEKIPAGAEGMVFIVNGLRGQFFLKHHVQSYVYLGYCITIITWFIVCCLSIYSVLKKHERST